MRFLPLIVLPLAAGLALSACQRNEPAPVPEPEPVAEPTLPPLPAPPDATPIDASYNCQNNRVDLINERATARIAMNDGRVVVLGGMRGSVPATWRDVGLTFTLDERQATPFIELAQDDGPALRCKAILDDVTTPEADTGNDAGDVHPDAAEALDNGN